MPTTEAFRDELSRRGFTDAAQRVLRHVGERASDRGMFAGELTEATAAMLAVLSIVRWERKLARAALEELAIDLSRFGQSVDDAIASEGDSVKRPGGPHWQVMPSGQHTIVLDQHTPLQPLMCRAEVESLKLQHNWVGTEHLLLAAISTACPRFQAILDENGIAHGAVKQAVVALLRPPA